MNILTNKLRLNIVLNCFAFALITCCSQLKKDNADQQSEKSPANNFQLAINSENVSTNLSSSNFGMEFPENKMKKEQLKEALKVLNTDTGKFSKLFISKLCDGSKKPSEDKLNAGLDLLAPLTYSLTSTHPDSSGDNEYEEYFEPKTSEIEKIKISTNDKKFFKSVLSNIDLKIPGLGDQTPTITTESTSLVQIGGNGNTVYGRGVMLKDFKDKNNKADPLTSNKTAIEYVYDLKTKVLKSRFILTGNAIDLANLESAELGNVFGIYNTHSDFSAMSAQLDGKSYFNGKLSITLDSKLQRIGDQINTSYLNDDQLIQKKKTSFNNKYLLANSIYSTSTKFKTTGACLMLESTDPYKR